MSGKCRDGVWKGGIAKIRSWVAHIAGGVVWNAVDVDDIMVIMADGD